MKIIPQMCLYALIPIIVYCGNNLLLDTNQGIFMSSPVISCQTHYVLGAGHCRVLKCIRDLVPNALADPRGGAIRPCPIHGFREGPPPSQAAE